MLGAAIGLLVIGLVVGFIIPPFGFLPGVIGLILLIVYAVGARRATQPRP